MFVLIIMFISRGDAVTIASQFWVNSYLDNYVFNWPKHIPHHQKAHPERLFKVFILEWEKLRWC